MKPGIVLVYQQPAPEDLFGIFCFTGIGEHKRKIIIGGNEVRLLAYSQFIDLLGLAEFAKLPVNISYIENNVSAVARQPVCFLCGIERGFKLSPFLVDGCGVYPGIGILRFILCQRFKGLLGALKLALFYVDTAEKQLSGCALRLFADKLKAEILRPGLNHR